MKKKFHIGCRVKVYATLNGVCAETKGTLVRYRSTDGMFYVNLDGRNGEIVAHPKQCRLLSPPLRRSLWVAQSGDVAAFKPDNSEGWTEFVEKKKPKELKFEWKESER